MLAGAGLHDDAGWGTPAAGLNDSSPWAPPAAGDGGQRHAYGPPPYPAPSSGSPFVVPAVPVASTEAASRPAGMDGAQQRSPDSARVPAAEAPVVPAAALPAFPPPTVLPPGPMSPTRSETTPEAADRNPPGRNTSDAGGAADNPADNRGANPWGGDAGNRPPGVSAFGGQRIRVP